MARFLLSLALLSIAAAASLSAAYAQPYVPSEPGVASDQPPAMTAGQVRARQLWLSLSAADKAFVTHFVATNNIELLSPDLLALRARGRNDMAIDMLAKYYDLHRRVRKPCLTSPPSKK